jgi:hypothetical protein
MAGIPRGHKAALGFRSHSGWACAILAIGHGDKIEIADRRRVVLHDPEIAGAKQPFHTAEPMAFADAETYLALCRHATDRLAREAVTLWIGTSQAHGAQLCGACVIAASSRVLPDLGKILASHALIHAAEGEFYRNALLRSAEASKITGRRLKAAEAAPRTASLLGISEDALTRKLAELGKRIGRPWTSDEKLATLAAWTLLAR